MKKSIFISEVRQKVGYASVNTLKELVINIAKYVPRDFYEEVLELFEKEHEIISNIKEKDLLSSVKELCESIEAGNYNLSWGYDEGYYDGYWSDDETLYDNDNLGGELEQLLKATMNCVLNRNYSTAVQAFEMLLSIEIPNEDYDDISVDTMFSNDLINLDYEQVLSHYAYAVLMFFKGEERVDRLFEIEEMVYYKLKLNDISAIGNDEIPDNNVFSKQWIEFLMQQDLKRYEGILIDAIKYDGGTNALEEFVLNYGITYQKAYIDLVETYMFEKKYENAVNIIKYGLSKTKGINETRTNLSDLLAEIGQKTNNNTYFREGLEEGFFSSIDLGHFLKLYDLNSNDVLAKAIEYLDKHSQQKGAGYYMIHFLNGDYELVFKVCGADKKYLGWSSSIKGQLQPLFMALLSGEEELKPCIKKLIEDQYFDNNFEVFANTLGHTLRKLPSEEYHIYFNWCVKEIEERVKAIVGGQYRGSYYKASALVVAMGEVLMSKGDKDGAIRFIRGYKEKFPRHTAFHGCLREDLRLSKIGNILG